MIHNTLYLWSKSYYRVLSAALIEFVKNYGVWVMFIITLLQSVGLPLPAFAIFTITAAISSSNLADIALLVFTTSVGSLRVI